MDPIQKKPKARHHIAHLHPLQRLFISVALSGLTFFVPGEHITPLLMVVIGWIIFAFSYTLGGWIILFASPVEIIKKVAKTDDGSKAFVFVMTLIASFASLFTVLILMISDNGESEPFIFISVVVIGMLVSWVMVHTMFAFHYAHMFYDDDESSDKENAEGLDFPGETKPDYIDFAYLAFVIGCTFQVSDVQVKSRKIRRMVLLHGLLSFVLNTFVVALTINLIASLNK